jgi:hypothetical protein
LVPARFPPAIHLKAAAMINATLPAVAFARHPETSAPIAIKRGEMGYSPVYSFRSIERLNAASHVTPQQAAAMLAGSMFGWDVPGADPERITEAEAHFILRTPVHEVRA